MPNKRCFMYDRANVKISIVLPFGMKKSTTNNNILNLLPDMILLTSKVM